MKTWWQACCRFSLYSRVNESVADTLLAKEVLTKMSLAIYFLAADSSGLKFGIEA